MPTQREHEGGSTDQHDGGAHHGGEEHGGGQGHPMKGMYLRFAAMILTAMVVMYWVMFVGSWEWSTCASARAASSWPSPWAARWA